MGNDSASLYTVEWAENPLASKVILTEVGRLRLELGVAKDMLMEREVSCQLAQEHNDLKWIRYYGKKVDGGVEADIQKWVKIYEEALLDHHDGDCTCQPASCLKCQAEERLGFWTIDGLGKHEGHAVSGAFYQSLVKTAEDAQRYLQGPIVCTWGKPGPELMARWRQEHENAIAWLETYRRERLGRVE